MSSMRNAVQRRNHRERGQLEGREKWGILEKHKDYSLRAKDYNTKKEKIKRLQEKVRDRNPDEFAFGMMSGNSARQGKHGSGARDSAAARGLSHDAIKLLKTQDAGYLRTVGERIRRQMEKLEEEVRLQDGMKEILDGEGEKKGEQDDMDEDDMDFDFDFGDEADKKSKKLVFADDRREQRTLKKKKLREEEEKNDDSDGEDDSFGKVQAQKKSRKQMEAERQALVEARRARKMKKRAAESRANKLKSLQKQYKDITAAERELDWQRGRMDNVVGGTNKNGVKWKIRERKR
ncbi:U3 small nucleolar RNA-associated protein 11 [Aspergillus sclerotioniger CBS 115572]|uniref:U3 small nucleolar RNA-associated protein 11 n=1 Tax=Aspergillus sclerotioniger CBS 115572 TaxID=1450535 RepID=A0A317WQE2_9EURO|nr:U3 small nucleolar RNA-associated protein 11 [Aspergillus sclerotioniger CBS 115572]PWY88653.1 U3 small nucleolar RNA-associated protein 11 [Aspergillus sclerotioniger CBS 115572]